jgi:hypothetical protein
MSDKPAKSLFPSKPIPLFTKSSDKKTLRLQIDPMNAVNAPIERRYPVGAGAGTVAGTRARIAEQPDNDPGELAGLHMPAQRLVLDQQAEAAAGPQVQIGYAAAPQVQLHIPAPAPAVAVQEGQAGATYRWAPWQVAPVQNIAVGVVANGGLNVNIDANAAAPVVLNPQNAHNNNLDDGVAVENRRAPAQIVFGMDADYYIAREDVRQLMTITSNAQLTDGRRVILPLSEGDTYIVRNNTNAMIIITHAAAGQPGVIIESNTASRIMCNNQRYIHF